MSDEKRPSVTGALRRAECYRMHQQHDRHFFILGEDYTQCPGTDTEGSASRQHFIDTGLYLPRSVNDGQE